MIDLPENVSYDRDFDAAYDRMTIRVGSWEHAATVHPAVFEDDGAGGLKYDGLDFDATEEEWDEARSEALAFLLRMAAEHGS